MFSLVLLCVGVMCNLSIESECHVSEVQLHEDILIKVQFFILIVRAFFPFINFISRSFTFYYLCFTLFIGRFHCCHVN